MTCAAVVGAVSSSLCAVKHVCGVWCVVCGVWSVVWSVVCVVCVVCGVCCVCGVVFHTVCVVDM